MKALKRFSVLFVLACILLTAASCAAKQEDPTSIPTEPTENTPTESESENKECEHSYKKEGIMNYTCEKCGNEKTEIPKSIKILAIGNSFSDDATEHLWHILDNAGIENITLGNLYIGGCSIDTHYSNSQNNAGAYEYRRNTEGTWSTEPAFKLGDALVDEEWDIVTFQQASHYSGQPSTYSNLDALVAYVRKRVPADCKFYWHMTWAYQQDSTHNGFANYDRDQMTMYYAISDTVVGTVLPKKHFEGILPSGTTIQNLRTSYIGDTLTRDGFHLSYGLGRYAAALTWFAALGGDVDSINWCPSFDISLDMPALREAVKNAVAEPFDVTKSTHKTAPDKSKAPLEDIFAYIGKDMNSYTELDTQEMLHSYYNSTDGANISNRVTTAGNSPQYTSTCIFAKTDLPEGTLIIIESGYQYRPEAWKSLSTVNAGSARPAVVSTTCVEVDAKWWGEWSYRGFNISHTSGRNLTAADLGRIHIFVPD